MIPLGNELYGSDIINYFQCRNDRQIYFQTAKNKLIIIKDYICKHTDKVEVCLRNSVNLFVTMFNM